MLTRITALFAILTLLLPSSLAAMAWSQPEFCLSQGNMPNCCCTHDQDATDQQGPSLSRGCCCEFEAPQSLPETPEPSRLANSGIDLDWLTACPQEQLLPSYSPAPLQTELREQGPPRAPPRPLFLVFQSFLI